MPFWTVDLIGDRKVVIVDDSGRAMVMDPSHLPPDLTKLDVLSIDDDEAGEPDWATAVIDADETERRRARSEDISRRLRMSDPKGFVYMPEE
jgi:hypothetical protein